VIFFFSGIRQNINEQIICDSSGMCYGVEQGLPGLQVFPLEVLVVWKPTYKDAVEQHLWFSPFKAFPESLNATKLYQTFTARYYCV
jgi:hypothetical protein